jgi:hypothetical protein
MGKEFHILNKDETTDSARDAIVVDTLVDAGDYVIAEGIRSRDDSKEDHGDEEDNAETKPAEAENEYDGSGDGFPAVLCDKHDEAAVANMEGAALAAVSQSSTEKGIPVTENEEEGFCSVKNLIALYSATPMTKNEENVERERFSAVLWDKKEDTVDAVGAVSASQEISEKGSTLETDKSNGEKNDNGKFTTPIEGAQSTVPRPEQEEVDVTIVCSGVPAGPSKRQSTGEQEPSLKDEDEQYDYIGLSEKVAKVPVTNDVMSAASLKRDDSTVASSVDNVVVVNLLGSEDEKDLHGDGHEKDLHTAGHGEKVAVHGDESADRIHDSWTTEPYSEDSHELLFASTTELEQETEATDLVASLPSLLGDSDVGELAPIVDDIMPKLDGAPQVAARHSTRSPSSLYKIGTTYFLLRERDGIEYPVKILSLGQSGTTCIVAYEHHRSKKKVRISNLLPDTPERRQKFEESLKSGKIDSDALAPIAKEVEQRKIEELRHQISRHNLPKCYIEGTLIKEPSRRVYFAKDRETVHHIAKKFNVPSERIVSDNQSAYPSLKKTSHLRPLTSIVLPP